MQAGGDFLIGGLVFGAANYVEIVFKVLNSIITSFTICDMIQFHKTTRIIYFDLVVSCGNSYLGGNIVTK